MHISVNEKELQLHADLTGSSKLYPIMRMSDDVTWGVIGSKPVFTAGVAVLAI